MQYTAVEKLEPFIVNLAEFQDRDESKAHRRHGNTSIKAALPLMKCRIYGFGMDRFCRKYWIYSQVSTVEPTVNQTIQSDELTRYIAMFSPPICGAQDESVT